MNVQSLLILIALYVCACSPQTSEISRDPSNASQLDTIKPATKDSTSLSKELIANTYRDAIADFIKAVQEQHKTKFDTLYFGRHVYGQPDDFPDIELPETIENTQIRLIEPDLGLKLQKVRKAMTYINMMGWVNQKKAEFIFVTFSNGGVHQYDCYINYTTKTDSTLFVLEKPRFDYFLYQGAR